MEPFSTKTTTRVSFSFFYSARVQCKLLLSPPFSGRREGHRNVQYVRASSGAILRKGLHRVFAL